MINHNIKIIIKRDKQFLDGKIKIKKITTTWLCLQIFKGKSVLQLNENKKAQTKPVLRIQTIYLF